MPHLNPVYAALAFTAFMAAPRQAPQPKPEPAQPAQAAAGQLPDKGDLADKMLAALARTPVLHMSAKCLHMGVAYEAEGWMTATRCVSEVRQKGKVIFAEAYSDGRVQEYVPEASFANGATAANVLLEYDQGDNTDDWPRLIDHDLACGPGTVAADSWIKTQHPTVPESLAERMRNDSVLSEAEVNGKACYRFHTQHDLGDGSAMTFDLYIDKSTFEPVKQSGLVTQNGRTVKNDAVSYRFEHLTSEEGITWRLDVGKLNAKK